MVRMILSIGLQLQCDGAAHMAAQIRKTDAFQTADNRGAAKVARLAASFRSRPFPSTNEAALDAFFAAFTVSK